MQPITPAAANKLWCPAAKMTRWAQQRLDSADQLPTLQVKCIAGRCAAWRWQSGQRTGSCGVAEQPDAFRIVVPPAQFL
jgi:hypothetical protein